MIKAIEKNFKWKQFSVQNQIDYEKAIYSSVGFIPFRDGDYNNWFLFKIMHWPGAGIMLTVGMLTEAIAIITLIVVLLKNIK